MECSTSSQLAAKKCVPCEGGVPPCTPDQVAALLAGMPGWQLSHGGQRIRKTWVVKNFLAGMRFFERVAELAEAEGHHPDLHLEGYRNVAIEIWTHAIGGLSEKLFEINRCFRNEGISFQHNPEFTQVEFYWAYATYEDLMQLTERLVSGVVAAAQGGKMTVERDGFAPEEARALEAGGLRLSFQPAAMFAPAT